MTTREADGWVNRWGRVRAQCSNNFKGLGTTLWGEFVSY